LKFENFWGSSNTATIKRNVNSTEAMQRETLVHGYTSANEDTTMRFTGQNIFNTLAAWDARIQVDSVQFANKMARLKPDDFC
jgi:hypothetical protein